MPLQVSSCPLISFFISNNGHYYYYYYFNKVFACTPKYWHQVLILEFHNFQNDLQVLVPVRVHLCGKDVENNIVHQHPVLRYRRTTMTDCQQIGEWQSVRKFVQFKSSGIAKKVSIFYHGNDSIIVVTIVPC
jgi:hypothetical protein